MTSYSNNESSSPAPLTGVQLSEFRQKQWHQNGEALLTFENARSWINIAGFVLFLPRPQVIADAPTFVEATIGAPTPSPTLAQIKQARELLSRLVAEGLAVPLNLLGNMQGSAPDNPDFVVSTSVFSYIFTLRGDKLWKQPPAREGALKISNLAIAAYEAISRRGPTSAYDLTTELGKEVTETAVLRALTELWHHLRVLPLYQNDETPTTWELTTSRFTKQIKAGANAGLPSAVSALVSLYLRQTIAASEDQIESFLSPLSSRSRVRDVLHALLAARELETISVDGRPMLHITGELPLVPELKATPTLVAPRDTAEREESSGMVGTDRIKKFVPKRSQAGTGDLAKARPARPSARPARPSARPARPSARPARPSARPSAGPARFSKDRERRPFKRNDAERFDKPWTEEKPKRAGWKPARPTQSRSAEESEIPKRPRFDRERSATDRPFTRDRKNDASRPNSGDAQSRPRRFGDSTKFSRSGNDFSRTKKTGERESRDQFKSKPRSGAPRKDQRFASDSSDRQRSGRPAKFSPKSASSFINGAKGNAFGEKKPFRKTGFGTKRTPARSGGKPVGRKSPRPRNERGGETS